MSLESFGRQLRTSREQKQMTLAAISDATRINHKFLEAIENGKFSILPQAYVRAFIRAYAKAVDLDADEAIRRYDEENREIQSAAEQWIARSRPAPAAPSGTLKQRPPLLSQLKHRELLLLGLTVLAIVAVAYFSYTTADSVPPETLQEVPFDSVVRETEAATSPEEQAKPATLPMSSPVSDSLRLEITTLDSVWMTILIDEDRKGEYLFAPNRKRSWAAREQFVISMGNAGNATFRLNGKDLGALGRKGAVVRGVLITDDGIHAQP
ncbi:MAG: RodZ domain-containing protein [Bacteroidota bacterium]